jgi:SAM-dependent methyltransferase
MMFRSSCDICGGSSFEPVSKYQVDPWPLVQCRNCGFVLLQTVPEYAALAEELAWEKSLVIERARRKKEVWGRLDTATRWRLRLKYLLRRAPRFPKGNVLNVGCGGGCRIPEGSTPYGIEISASLAARAAPLFEARGGRVVHAPAVEGLSGLSTGQFQAILMRSYLEHEAQPRKALSEAVRCLAPGGLIHVRVPNFASLNRRIVGRRWCGFRFPDHVNYFTPKTLRALAEDVGLIYQPKRRLSLLDDNITADLLKAA